MQIYTVCVAGSLPRSHCVSSRNAPPLWGGALRDETQNGCEGDYVAWGGDQPDSKNL